MRYCDLLVLRKSIELVEYDYKLTRRFPISEKVSLMNQIRRAAVSVPSNIAEGHGRKATGAYLNHLSISFGSLMELETQAIIAKKLMYINNEQLKSVLNKTDEIGKMLSGLINSLRKK